MSSPRIEGQEKSGLLRWANDFDAIEKKQTHGRLKPSVCVIKSFDNQKNSSFEISAKHWKPTKALLHYFQIFFNAIFRSHAYELEFQIKSYQKGLTTFSKQELKDYLEKNQEATIGDLFNKISKLDTFVSAVSKKKHIEHLKNESDFKNVQTIFLEITQEKVQESLKGMIESTKDSFLSHDKIEEFKKKALDSFGINDLDLGQNLLTTKVKATETVKVKLIDETQKYFTTYVANDDKKIPLSQAAASLWNTLSEEFDFGTDQSLLEFQEKFYDQYEVAYTKIIDDAVAGLPKSVELEVSSIGRPIITYKQKGSQESRTISSFMQSISNRISPNDESALSYLKNCIQAKYQYSDSKPFASQIVSLYETKSLPESIRDKYPSFSTLFLSELSGDVLTGVEDDISEMSGKVTHDNITKAQKKLSDLRTSHLDIIGVIGEFFLEEGALFITNNDQDDLSTRINTIYQDRFNLYYKKNSELAQAALALEGLDETEKVLKGINAALFDIELIDHEKAEFDIELIDHEKAERLILLKKAERLILLKKAGRLILLVQEHQKAAVKISANTTSSEVTEKAKEIEYLCTSIIKVIDSTFKSTSEGKTSNTPVVNNFSAQNINIQGSGNQVGNFAAGRDIINKPYVSSAENANKAYSNQDTSSILSKVFGQTVSAAIPGLIFGGIPGAITAGTLAATQAIAQPLTQYALEKSGASPETAQIVSFLAAISMASYTQSYVTAYLQGRIEPILPQESQKQNKIAKPEICPPQKPFGQPLSPLHKPELITPKLQMVNTAQVTQNIFKKAFEGITRYISEMDIEKANQQIESKAASLSWISWMYGGIAQQAPQVQQSTTKFADKNSADTNSIEQQRFAKSPIFQFNTPLKGQ